MQKHSDGIKIKVPFKLPDTDNVVLENYCDNSYGFMRLKLTTKNLEGKFYSVASPHVLWYKSVKKVDEFELDLQHNMLA
jgi:hypothetical protein